MSNHTVKRIAEMESIFHGAFRKAGAELEVESFGMNIIELPPGAGEHYPEHTHEHDEQEEVYIALRGSGTITVDGTDHPLDADTIVRCGAAAVRKVASGPDGLRLLVLGGTPGRAYDRPEVFRKGTPDPTAG